jgi:excisionase family DNA binding protein
MPGRPIEQLQTYTCAQLAALLQVSRGWVEDAASRGEIPHLRFGRMIRFTADQIETLYAKCEQPAPAHVEPLRLVPPVVTSRRRAA